MAPSRRQSNGRTPWVNQRFQITAFFSKSATPSPSPSPMISKQTSKLNPKPNPSSSPTTPSPVQSKPKKPLLDFGGTTLSPNLSYGEEIVDKRIKVYWPLDLDKVRYECSIKSFDKETGKHLVQHDDGGEKFLDLRKEKIQLIEEGAKRLKRLRRGSSLACEKKLLLEEEEDQGVRDLEDNNDDSSEEDWGKNNAEKELSKNNADDTDLNLIDEDEEMEGKQSRKRKVSGGIASKRRL